MARKLSYCADGRPTDLARHAQRKPDNALYLFVSLIEDRHATRCAHFRKHPFNVSRARAKQGETGEETQFTRGK